MSTAPLLFVASGDSHLTQLWALRPWWKRRNRVWVTQHNPEAVTLLGDEDVHWAHHSAVGNLSALFRATTLAVRTLKRDRPAAVVSTGASIAVPFFLLAWLMRIPTVYIEGYEHITKPSLTARLCRPFTTLFLTQWEEQRACAPSAFTVGPLL